MPTTTGVKDVYVPTPLFMWYGMSVLTCTKRDSTNRSADPHENDTPAPTLKPKAVFAFSKLRVRPASGPVVPYTPCVTRCTPAPPRAYTFVRVGVPGAWARSFTSVFSDQTVMSPLAAVV